MVPLPLVFQSCSVRFYLEGRCTSFFSGIVLRMSGNLKNSCLRYSFICAFLNSYFAFLCHSNVCRHTREYNNSRYYYTHYPLYNFSHTFSFLLQYHINSFFISYLSCTSFFYFLLYDYLWNDHSISNCIVNFYLK